MLWPNLRDPRSYVLCFTKTFSFSYKIVTLKIIVHRTNIFYALKRPDMPLKRPIKFEQAKQCNQNSPIVNIFYTLR